MWDVWWIKCHWMKFVSKYFICPLYHFNIAPYSWIQLSPQLRNLRNWYGRYITRKKEKNYSNSLLVSNKGKIKRKTLCNRKLQHTCMYTCTSSCFFSLLLLLLLLLLLFFLFSLFRADISLTKIIGSVDLQKRRTPR
jgi:hypothetical protein